jgi:phosphohistidine phosphatase SixA
VIRARYAALLLAAGAASAAAAQPACDPASVTLTRHAEKAELAGDTDPPLSDAGRATAAALQAWFDDKPLDAIYATHLRRTQQTALPLAAARDLELRVLDAGSTPRLLQRLRSRHCGEHVLVVGHSNTVPGIAVALGAPAFEIGEHDFGTAWRWTPGQPLAHVHYASPPAR